MILTAAATDKDGLSDRLEPHQWIQTPTARPDEPHVLLTVHADAAYSSVRLTQQAALALAEQLQDAVAAIYGEVRRPEERSRRGDSPL